MTFLAKSNDLNSILPRLRYETLLKENDVLNLTIYDGADGDCISTQEHFRRSDMNTQYFGLIKPIYNKCYTTSYSVSIQSSKYTEGNHSGFMQNNVPFHLWVALGVGSILISYLLWKFKQKVHLGMNRNPTNWIRNNMRLKYTKCEEQENHEEESIVFENEAENQEVFSDSIYDKESTSVQDMNSEDTRWIQHLDNETDEYYYENEKTRRVTWTKPTEDDGIILFQVHTKEDECHQSDKNEEEEPLWIKYLDDKSGEYYFKNIHTRRITWTAPDTNTKVISYDESTKLG